MGVKKVASLALGNKASREVYPWLTERQERGVFALIGVKKRVRLIYRMFVEGRPHGRPIG